MKMKIKRNERINAIVCKGCDFSYYELLCDFNYDDLYYNFYTLKIECSHFNPGFIYAPYTNIQRIIKKNENSN